MHISCTREWWCMYHKLQIFMHTLGGISAIGTHLVEVWLVRCPDLRVGSMHTQTWHWIMQERYSISIESLHCCWLGCCWQHTVYIYRRENLLLTLYIHWIHFPTIRSAVMAMSQCSRLLHVNYSMYIACTQAQSAPLVTQNLLHNFTTVKRRLLYTVHALTSVPVPKLINFARSCKQLLSIYTTAHAFTYAYKVTVCRSNIWLTW